LAHTLTAILRSPISQNTNVSNQIQPLQLAVDTWNAISDGRTFKDLHEDYRFRLLNIAREVVAGRTADIAGLEAFEVKARELFERPPKSVDDKLIGLAEFIAKAANMGHVPHVANSILQTPAFAESVYKAAVKNYHPDKGGTEQQFQQLENAMATVRRSHDGGQK